MPETVRCSVCDELYFPGSKLEYDAQECPKCRKRRLEVQGADAPPAPDSEAGIDRQALVQAVVQMEKAVDAVYMNAMSISRLVGLGPPDIPRLCIMAACRLVERMIETYQELRTRSGASGVRDKRAVEELERRKAEIGQAVELLLHTLADGLTTTQQIQQSLALKVNVQ